MSLEFTRVPLQENSHDETLNWVDNEEFLRSIPQKKVQDEELGFAKFQEYAEDEGDGPKGFFRQFNGTGYPKGDKGDEGKP